MSSIAAVLAQPKPKNPCGPGTWIAQQDDEDRAAIDAHIATGRRGGKTRNKLHKDLVEVAGFPYSPSALNIHARGDCNCYRSPATDAES